MSNGLEDFSLFDLFRMEAEEQVRVLQNGLIELESGAASAATLEALMRAAHSLKGAARIVGLDAIVNLTHVVEDRFCLLYTSSWTGYGIYEAAQLAIPISFLEFSREFEAEADWLGLQYLYKAGYDPQAFIQFFEKITALEKHKPGTLAKVFADHPQTPDRIAHSEEEIATILPARPDYVVTTSEFDDVKALSLIHI